MGGFQRGNPSARLFPERFLINFDMMRAPGRKPNAVIDNHPAPMCGPPTLASRSMGVRTGANKPKQQVEKSESNLTATI